MWLHAVHFRTVPYRTRTFNMPVRYGTRKQRTVHPPYTYIRNLCTVRYGTEGFVHYPLYGSKNVRYGTVRFDNVRYVEPSLPILLRVPRFLLVLIQPRSLIPLQYNVRQTLIQGPPNLSPPNLPLS